MLYTRKGCAILNFQGFKKGLRLGQGRRRLGREKKAKTFKLSPLFLSIRASL